MLKRGTVLLLLGAIALGGGVILLESQQRPAANKPTEQANKTGADTLSKSVSNPDTEGDKAPIFPFAEEDVASLTIARSDGTLAFSKSADGTWQMTKPEQKLAESGAIAFLLDQLTSPPVRSLSVEPSTLSDFELESPNATVTLVAKGSTYQLAVGGDDFTGDKLYVQTTKAPRAPEAPATQPDPKSSDSVEIYLVSGGLKNAVNRPTPEWLAAAEAYKGKAPTTEKPAATAP
ncbi:MAG: DUF4340 domain-containing protein [Phormidesmis sp.]